MDFFSIELSDDDFNKLGQFIYNNYGIKMPITKKNLLKSRLHCRLKANNFNSFKEYTNYILSNKNNHEEIIHMIDVVSTNKTEFFREESHFDFIVSQLLPELTNNSSDRELKLWSCASSSGEEVYTLGMILSHYSESVHHLKFSILGTDISKRILEKAVKAVYDEERIKPIPYHLKKKYLMRNVNIDQPDYRIAPEIRQRTSFQRLNLMDERYDIPKDFDIVFCRNVLIYFDRTTQEKVISNICNHLKPNGLLFLGHSESASGYKLPLKQIKPTIYKKID